MRTFTLTLSFVLVISYAGAIFGDNSRAYTQARQAMVMVDFLVKDGPTDSDAQKIDENMGLIRDILPSLTSEQQSELWNRYPYFAGIACFWPGIGHEFSGNDCAFQCGTLSECLSEVQQ
jgi:hypothetical protein